MNRIKHNKGNFHTLYGSLIAIVAIALVGISPYLQNSISGYWRRGADSIGFGRQYVSPIRPMPDPFVEKPDPGDWQLKPIDELRFVPWDTIRTETQYARLERDIIKDILIRLKEQMRTDWPPPWYDIVGDLTTWETTMEESWTKGLEGLTVEELMATRRAEAAAADAQAAADAAEIALAAGDLDAVAEAAADAQAAADAADVAAAEAGYSEAAEAAAIAAAQAAAYASAAEAAAYADAAVAAAESGDTEAAEAAAIAAAAAADDADAAAAYAGTSDAAAVADAAYSAAAAAQHAAMM